MKINISRKSPELLILLMTVGSAVGFAVWINLVNNFAIERVDFTGAEIGILQSIREIPGFWHLRLFLSWHSFENKKQLILPYFFLVWEQCLPGLSQQTRPL